MNLYDLRRILPAEVKIKLITMNGDELEELTNGEFCDKDIRRPVNKYDNKKVMACVPNSEKQVTVALDIS